MDLIYSETKTVENYTLRVQAFGCVYDDGALCKTWFYATLFSLGLSRGCSGKPPLPFGDEILRLQSYSDAEAIRETIRRFDENCQAIESYVKTGGNDDN